ncbi:hypothetical protein CP532_5159 [Ophiocordyceps camponoti-leonardi (nom. inval.)]|nr:hypothetical protein CP532_5159 [Ophiocordyceps camponoti-leonardi (nom. inval.)]
MGSKNPGSSDELMPIAIVGMAGKFPGEATNPEKFWEMLSRGKSALSKVPAERFNIDAFYHPSPEHHGTTNAQGGNFLRQDISSFDAPFFSITPKEAQAMDPQQRLALEVAYEGLENEVIPPDVMSNKGNSWYEHSYCFRDFDGVLYGGIHKGLCNVKGVYDFTGNAMSMISNRISWFFNLRGPSISLDTACSSSLVALHLACQSLRNGEATSAIVGGTNAILMPELQTAMSSLHFLSPDCKSMAFDHRANGYARGEGAAVVVLKPLFDALRDGNVVRAVIRGSGVNQDGKTPGITVPSLQAQKELIEATYANAGLSFKDTLYVEAHGTVGDPIECTAIGSTIGQLRNSESPLLIGSAKTNIGHLESAAGLAGLIKTVYILEKGLIPPSLWFEKANPSIPFQDLNLEATSVNSFGYGGTNAHCILDDALHYLELRGLQGLHNTERHSKLTNGQLSGHENGVSFVNGNGSKAGYIDDYPKVLTNGNGHHRVSKLQKLKTTTVKPQLLIWSSHDEQGILRTAKNLASYVKTRDDHPEEKDGFLKRLAFTLAGTRHEFSWRSFVIGTDSKEALSALEQQPIPVSKMQSPPIVAFIFTGQGAQWFAMGRQLLIYDAFHESLSAASAYFKASGAEWDLIGEAESKVVLIWTCVFTDGTGLDELLADENNSRINEAILSHPASASLQVALVDLLTSWGMKPSVVIGHSSGEVGVSFSFDVLDGGVNRSWQQAAYARRAITRESVWKVAFQRGRLAGSVRREGGMLAVGLGEDEAQAIIDENGLEGIVVACINSPVSVTLSGDVAAISTVKELLDERKVFSRRLAVTTAYHSPHMNDIADEYREALSELAAVPSPDEDEVKMFSSVTGELIDPSSLARPSHWVENMLRPVKFLQAVEAALSYRPDGKSSRKGSEGFNLMIEIGPHSALQMPLKQILTATGKENAVKYTTMLTRKQDATKTALNAMGVLYQHGYEVDIRKVNRPSEAEDEAVPLVDVPPYAWNHEHKYWSESALCRAFRTRKHPRHDLLGYPDEHSASQEPSWRNLIRVSELPWLEHHRVQSTVLYPFSGMVIMAIEAVRQIDGGEVEIKGYHLRDVSVDTALIITGDAAVETKVQLRPWRRNDSSWKQFAVFSRNHQHGTWTQHCQGLISVCYRSSVFDEEKIAWHRREADEMYRRGLDAKDPGELYRSWNELGLQWTDSFQSILHLSSGDHEARFTLRVQDTRAYMPREFQHDHVIHPTTLDGVLQTILPACATRETPLSKAQVPRFVQEAYVSHRMMNESPGHDLRGYSRFDPFRSEGSIVTFDDGWDEMLVVLEGIRLAGISQEVDASEQDVSSTWSLEWGLDVEALPHNSLDKFLRAAVDAVPHVNEAVIHDLELASYIICKRISRRFSAEKAQSFAAHHSLFFEYIQRQCRLAEQGKLVCQPALDSSEDWLHINDEAEDVLLNRAFTTSVDGRLLSRVADSLAQILDGEMEPLQILRQDDLLTEYYRSCIGIDKMNAGLAHFVKTLSHKRPLRIIEVGAGTGGTTLAVLSAFGSEREAASRLQLYTYTDISSGFFEDAAQSLDRYSQLLDYKVLDVEKDPAAQGFEVGSYDLVIATKVLHACGSIDRCLHHCRKLLKPDGYLALVELTSTTARTPMIFGMLTGWWLGENDGRKWGPRLSEEEWDSHLRKQGFEEGLSVSIRDDDRDCFSHALLISRASSQAVSRENLGSSVFIVQRAEKEGDEESASSRLARSFVDEGFRVQRISLADVPEYDLGDKRCVVTLEVDGPFLQDASESEFSAVKKLLLDSRSTLWLTKGALGFHNPETNLITGLARTIRKEYPETQLTILDIDNLDPTTEETTWSTVARMLRFPSPGYERESEIALRDGNVHVPRFHQEETSSPTCPESGVVYTSVEESGNAFALQEQSQDKTDQESLHFTECNEFPFPLGPNDVEIKVKAVDLSNRNVTAQSHNSSPTSLQCSGIVTRTGQAVSRFKEGDRVLTYRQGSCRTHVRNAEKLVHDIPDSMSFEKAASLLFTYVAAQYALKDVGHLQPGENILIFASTRDVAVAAIVLSRHMGAETFVAVSKPGLKQLLINDTGLSEDRVFCSFQHGLASEIGKLTGGRGVDLILSTSRGQSLCNVSHCVQPFGRFVEVGGAGSESRDVNLFGESVIFASVNMESLASTKSPVLRDTVSSIMEYVDAGVVAVPEPGRVIPFSQCGEAFEILRDEERVILSSDDDGLLPVMPSQHRPLMLVPDATYMICIGHDEVGFASPLISFLTSKGATHIILVKTGDDEESSPLLPQLQDPGLNYRVISCDLGNASGFQHALNDLADSWPPIRGVVMLNSPAEQTPFEDVSVDQFRKMVTPTIKATRTLHKLLPKALDFFIILSSPAGSKGLESHDAGKSVYAFQSSLMRHRQAMGLAGTFISFESASQQHITNGSPKKSNIRVSSIEMLKAVEKAMRSPASSPPEIIVYTPTDDETPKQSPPLTSARHTFIQAKSDEQQDGSNSSTRNASSSTACELAAELSSVKTIREASAIVLSSLVGKLARLIMVDEKEIDADKAASAYHIDSLMAIEIRMWALKQVGSDVSVFEVLSNEPLAELALRIASRSSLVPGGIRGVNV